MIDPPRKIAFVQLQCVVDLTIRAALAKSRTMRFDDEPKFSVIVPVHNGAKTISRALASIEGQTFLDWEAIVVDDCSTDNTYVALRSWAARDSRFRLVRLAENRGSSGARNAASGTRSVPDTSAYCELFAGVTHQPGPPLVPLDVVMDEERKAAETRAAAK